MVTRSNIGAYKPKVFISLKDSLIVEDTLKDTSWKSAMIEEYATLAKNGTWSLVYLPSNPSLPLYV